MGSELVAALEHKPEVKKQVTLRLSETAFFEISRLATRFDRSATSTAEALLEAAARAAAQEIEQKS